MRGKIKTREIKCKSAIGKCGFPGGGWAINPYVGCSHGCVYCYARFMRRFTGHTEPWGTFVDARINITEILGRQMRSQQYKNGRIYIGTVTDPYQPLEEKHELMRGVLEVLTSHKNPVSILTKSDLILRDLDLLKQLKGADVNFTINTLDAKWQKLVEPNSSTAKERLRAARKLVGAGIEVSAMIGPYWPIFTDPEALFKEFKEVGICHVFTESFNTIGGNFVGVERVLRKHYPQHSRYIKETLFNKDKFHVFYEEAAEKIRQLVRQYNLPTTIFFGPGHATKFK